MVPYIQSDKDWAEVQLTNDWQDRWFYIQIALRGRRLGYKLGYLFSLIYGRRLASLEELNR